MSDPASKKKPSGMKRIASAVKHPKLFFRKKKAAKDEAEAAAAAKPAAVVTTSAAAADDERILRHKESCASDADARTLVHKTSYPSTTTSPDGSDYLEHAKPGKELAIEIAHDSIAPPQERVDVAQIVLPPREDAAPAAAPGKTLDEPAEQGPAAGDIEGAAPTGVLDAGRQITQSATTDAVQPGVIETILEETEVEAADVSEPNGGAPAGEDAGSADEDAGGADEDDHNNGIMIRYETWEERRDRMHIELPSSTLPGSWPRWFD